MAQLFAQLFYSTILGLIGCCYAEPEVPRLLLQMVVSTYQPNGIALGGSQQSDWMKSMLERLSLGAPGEAGIPIVDLSDFASPTNRSPSPKLTDAFFVDQPEVIEIINESSSQIQSNPFADLDEN